MNARSSAIAASHPTSGVTGAAAPPRWGRGKRIGDVGRRPGRVCVCAVAGQLRVSSCVRISEGAATMLGCEMSATFEAHGFYVECSRQQATDIKRQEHGNYPSQVHALLGGNRVLHILLTYRE